MRLNSSLIFRLKILLLLVCVGCHQKPSYDGAAMLDPDLQRLTAALGQAETQTAMNLVSKEISEFWDTKLASTEHRVTLKLDDEQKLRFADSRERWRIYREKEVQFRSDLFAGGSIQPLIANESYSQITQHRVAELESIFSDALAGKQ